MYQEIKCVCIECDVCKETFQDDFTGFSIFIDKQSAIDRAQEYAWHETEDEKHYCPKCHSFDDEDNLVINQPPTKL